jgi:hypothetical protein
VKLSVIKLHTYSFIGSRVDSFVQTDGQRDIWRLYTELKFDFQKGQDLFFPTSFTRASEIIHLLIPWEPGPVALGVRRPGCKAHHSPPSNAEVKNV